MLPQLVQATLFLINRDGLHAANMSIANAVVTGLGLPLIYSPNLQFSLQFNICNWYLAHALWSKQGHC